MCSRADRHHRRLGHDTLCRPGSECAHIAMFYEDFLDSITVDKASAIQNRHESRLLTLILRVFN
jgi:hypothetical protein